MANLIRIKQINQAEISGFISETFNTGQIPVLVAFTGQNLVFTTGSQTISGAKLFATRPTVNGTGLALVNEIQNIVFQTGDQIISGLKNFSTKLQVNGVEVALSNEIAPNIPTGFLVLTTGNQIISGRKDFNERPTIQNILPLLASGDVPSSGDIDSRFSLTGNKLSYDIQVLSGDAVLNFGNQTIEGFKTFNSGIILAGANAGIPTDFNTARNLQWRNLGGVHSATLYGAYNGYPKIALSMANSSPSPGTSLVDLIEFRGGSTSGIFLYTSIRSNVSITGNLNVTGNIFLRGDQNINGDLSANNLVYNTGDQNISGVKTFGVRPTVNNTGVLLIGEPDRIETSWFSFTPTGSDINLGLNTDIFPAWNNQRFNSNENVFQLVNSGQSGINPVARVAIKQPGYYNIGFQYYGYDLKLDQRATIKLYRSSEPNTAFSLVRWMAKGRFPPLSDSDGDTFSVDKNFYISSSGYYSATLICEDLNPFTIKAHDASFGIPTFSFQLTKLRSV